MSRAQESSESGQRIITTRRAVGAAALLSVLGLVTWLFGRGPRSRGEPEPILIPPSGPRPETAAGPGYSVDDRRALLTLARRSLEQVVREGRLPEVPAGLPPGLSEHKGCFVTLTKGGKLRGCIGHIFPQEPLAQAVIHNARSAATQDSRFSPVTPDELAAIDVEVSVLSVPRTMEFTTPDDLLKKLRPNEDGVVLTVDGHRATFLPQVWEQLPTPESFLDHLSAKAGAGRGAWRSPGTEVMIYHVEAFHESDLVRADGG